MRLTQLCVVLNSLTLLGASVAAQQTASTACSVPAVSAQGPASRLSVGNYDLTLVTTSGLKAGSAATGSLWLARTSPSDSSSVTGRRPARSGRRGVPYYGAVKLDFERVGAPVFRDDTLVPPPES